MRMRWIGVVVAWAALLPSGRARAQAAGSGAEAQPVDEGLQEQLRLQREEIARLQQEMADRQIERERLGQVVALLASLRQRAAAQEAAQAEAVQQQQAAVAQQQQDVSDAVDLLREADRRLFAGETFVGTQLDQAAALLDGPMRRYVEAARISLQQSDLSAARAEILAAISLSGITP
jgi:hypothetical protein